MVDARERDGKAGGMDRRAFMRRIGQGALAAAAAGDGSAVAGPFTAADTIDHFVPADKKLRPEWRRALFARGERTWYAGKDLETIGMPVGGICAGQVYLTGDGRLVYWDIFNQQVNSGYGQVNYKVGRKPTTAVNVRRVFEMPPLDQGLAVRVSASGRSWMRTLDRHGFPGARFCGEYPIGFVDYADPDFPVDVRLEAFSPFIPLAPEDSALPATVLRYTVRNTTNLPLRVTLAGWLENAVCRHSGPRYPGLLVRTIQPVRGDGLTTLSMAAVPRAPERAERARPPQVFADFEGPGYRDWKVEGEAFGTGPAGGTLPNQQAVSGFRGKGLANTYRGGDAPKGKLVSPPFTIGRPYIAFLVGGGAHAGATCINLVVDGRIVRTATGRNEERLRPHNWDVRDLRGKEARIEIVDAASGPWGHINIDQIEFRDTPLAIDAEDVRGEADFGTMALSVLGDGVRVSPSLPDDARGEAILPDTRELPTDGRRAKPFGERLRGALARSLELAPGAEEEVVFIVSWCTPNLRRGRTLVGNRYAARFGDAAAVARYVAGNLDRLAGATRLWHDTYYDSTLPRWLLDRIHSTVCNLATTTCQWWKNGRFWAWEGCGCCRGTCGHVWNYAHALARLFPSLERSARRMQDFAPGVGFIPETGEIRFRGEGWGLWAGDAQGGYILKAYREHLTSEDDAFLRELWPRIRRAVRFLIDQDGDADGLLEGAQHQTYDQNYYGPNTMVGSLYLGALRAAEAMATRIGDAEFAARCRRIFEAGRKHSVEELFDGEYFIQKVDLRKHPEWQYAEGCLSDQVFGQGWAHQVGLGYLYPRDAVLSALRSIWKYNWAPDVGPQNRAHKPERWFAYPGEAGLFTCTWPKSRHLGPRSTRYRNEVWTGIEYQVAGHMAWEGMLTEALAICRAIHERYLPSKHNPWNEIECGDHYARALASWGVLTGLSGFACDGPDGRIGFAPRLRPEAFRAAFTAAAGWGTFAQERAEGRQVETIALKYGTLRLRELAFRLDGARAVRLSVTRDGAAVPATFAQEEDDVRVTPAAPLRLRAGETLRVEIA